MSFRCILFGHDYGSYQNLGEVREKRQGIPSDGDKIKEKVFSVRKRQRECKICGDTETTRDEKWKETRTLADELTTELPPRDQIRPINSLTNTESEKIYSTLEEFVRGERETERQSNWTEYEDSDTEQQVQNGKLIGPLVPMKNVDSHWFKLADHGEQDRTQRTRTFPQDELFTGSTYVADSLDSTSTLPLEVKLDRVKHSSNTLKISIQDEKVNENFEEYDFNTNTDTYLYPLLNPTAYNRRLDAIKEIRSDSRKREILSGNQTVSFTHRYPAPDPDIELNEYQFQALVWAHCADDFVLIHGPPGTGKTRVLTAYTQHATSQGQSVLITAHSNQAVDNLLVGDSSLNNPEQGTLHYFAQQDNNNVSIARVGTRHRINDVVKEYYYQDDKDTNISGKFDVIAATTNGAARFNKNQFDVAVVDEATQASRPATAIALNSAEKLVLAGDHKQLPPYCADESQKEEEMHISLFEHLLNRYGDYVSVLLRKQYRMNEEIAAFPNKEFYDGQLETAEQNREWSVSDLNPFIGVDIDGQERQRNYGNSYYNPDEAEAVAKQVQLLAMNGVAAEDIGVISAYSGQVSEIINQVNQLDIENPRHVNIDTVDSFQGGEREAIIVSFVRSNDDGHSGFLEFPEEGPRRLNVALTRARKRLVVIGNWETLGTLAPHRSEEQSCAFLYDRLAEHLRSREMMLSTRE